MHKRSKAHGVNALYRTIAALILTATMLVCAAPAHICMVEADTTVSTETRTLWKWRRVTSLSGLKEGKVYKCLIMWKSSDKNDYYVFAGEEGGMGYYSTGFTDSVHHLWMKVNYTESEGWSNEKMNSLDPAVTEFTTPDEIPSAYIKIVSASNTPVTLTEYHKNFTAYKSGEKKTNRFLLYTDRAMNTQLQIPTGLWDKFTSDWNMTGIFANDPSFHMIADGDMVKLAMPTAAESASGNGTATSISWRIIQHSASSIRGATSITKYENSTISQNLSASSAYFWVGEQVDTQYAEGDLEKQTFACDDFYIDKDKDFTILKDGVLIVRGTLHNAGRITNKGTIIVCNGGSIVPTHDIGGAKGEIICDGSLGQGNLIICKGGYLEMGEKSGRLVLSNGASLDNNGTMLLPYGIEMGELHWTLLHTELLGFLNYMPNMKYVYGYECMLNGSTLQNEGIIYAGCYYKGTEKSAEEAIKQLTPGTSKTGVYLDAGRDYSMMRSFKASSNFTPVAAQTVVFPSMVNEGDSLYIGNGNSYIEETVLKEPQ